LKNHAPDLSASDFFTVPTATFRVLFVLVALSHRRRRLVHFDVTEHPTAEWTARQLIEACGQDESPRIRDRVQVYGERFSRQARMLDLREAVIAPRSPWQNAYAERDPDTLIAGQGRARAAERAAAKPGQGGGGAMRGWAPSRIPPENSVSRSTNKWKAQVSKREAVRIVNASADNHAVPQSTSSSNIRGGSCCMLCRAKASSVSQVGLDAATDSVLFFVTGGLLLFGRW
jgi:transposase InsO family protein